MADIPQNMTGKICMVTGASSGIGQATALALAHLDATMIIVGRSQKKSKNTVQMIKKATGNVNVDYLLADLSTQKELFQLAENFKNRYQRLDILVNNAGAKFVKRLETVDGLEMSFALNHLAYFILTMLLLDSLKNSNEARIINVSSDSHRSCPGINFNDLQSANNYIGKQAYAQSKLANILFTYELSERLKGTGVTVNALTPGGVASNFCKNNGWISWMKHITAHILALNLIGLAEAARTAVFLATSSEVMGISGQYFSKQKSIRSSAACYDKETANRLWRISLELSGLAEPSLSKINV